MPGKTELYVVAFCCSILLCAVVTDTAKPSFMPILDLLVGKYAFSLEETETSCPQFWMANMKQLPKEETTGLLGSLDELREFYNRTANSSTVWNIAEGLLSYVCYVANASAPGTSLKPPPFEDVKNISNVTDVCNALGDVKMQKNLCSAFFNHSTANRALVANPIDCDISPNEDFKQLCLKNCSDNNLNVCKMILKGVRTVLHWEKSQNNSAFEEDTESPKPAEVPTPDRSNKTVANHLNGTTTLSNNLTDTKNSTAFSNTTTSINGTTSTTASSEKAGTDFSTQEQEADEQLLIDEPPLADQDESNDPSSNLEPKDLPGKKEKEEIELLQENDDNGDKEMDFDAGSDRTEPRRPNQNYSPQSDSDEATNTHFLFYFLAFVVVSACGYVCYQRRNRIIAFVLEGRSSSSGRRRSTSRHASGSYRKLVNNLEEAISSPAVKTSNVIY